MTSFLLYVRYAMRSFVRGRTRSLFGAFCVAVGIASVVALGLVGANFNRALSGDARHLTRGDLYASPPGWAFTSAQFHLFAQLKARGEITEYTPRFQDGAALRTLNPGGGSAIGAITAVDPSRFPFYDTITATRPEGRTLAQLLRTPHDAAVSADTLATLHLKIGDSIVVNSQHGLARTYTITGVVPDNAPDPGFGAGFWNDTIMIDQRSTLPFFSKLDAPATTVYMTTSSPAQAEKVKRELQRSLGALATVKTIADVAKDSKSQTDAMNKFLRVMGLVAVVIGGIGIINTMVVAARRRTREISVLKSIGMKGRQVVYVFVLEALCLAVAGSVLGVLGGIGASFVVNTVTEGVAGYAIPWTLQAGPIVSGVLVGVVATVLFAYLPIVKASRARPVAALRDTAGGPTGGAARRFLSSLRHAPGRTLFVAVVSIPGGIVRAPKRPGFRTACLTLAIAIAMGRLAILYTGFASGGRAVVVGAAVGIGALVAAGVLTQLFVTVIWLFSRLPSLGRLSFSMAFRSMRSQRRRLASTMLALCVGMLSVGSVSILATNVKTYFSGGLPQQIHTNAIIQSPHDRAIAARLQSTVAQLPGVQHVSYGLVSNSAQLLTPDGRDATTTLARYVKHHPDASSNAGQWATELRTIEGRQIGPFGYHYTIVHGRTLTVADRGKGSLLLPADLMSALGLTIGSRVFYADGAQRIPFTIVGSFDPRSFTVMSSALADPTYMRHAGLSTPSTAHLSLTYVQIAQPYLKHDLAVLRAQVHGAMVLDVGNFLTSIDKTLNKLTLFPEIIAAMSLFAGAIIIANTVALAMLERRREIGVMKAVGARRRTILQFLFVENALVGLLGAGAGVGLAMLATLIVDRSYFKIAATYDPATVVGLLLLGVLLAVGASAFTALPASSEKPMTVLRYE
jgi:ABC-type antimicrobial peptide transport system permease subunit